MKKLFRPTCLLLVVIMVTNNAFAQTLDEFFRHKGTSDLCQAAHPSNDYLEGKHDIYDGYVDVSLKSKDNVFGGTIHTNLRLVRGTGDLFFSDMIVQEDDDMVKPFDAFGLEAQLMIELYKSIDKETYDKMRNAIQKNFNTDFEHWTGKMWALLAINIDYSEYRLTGK